MLVTNTAKKENKSIVKLVQELLGWALVTKEPARIKRMYQDLSQLENLGPKGVKNVSTTINQTLYGGGGVKKDIGEIGHQNLDTTQIYARIYDETLYRQFKEAMARLEAIEVEDWPGVEQPASTPLITA